MPGEVHHVGQAPSDQGVHLHPVDARRPRGIPIGRVLHGQAGQRRRDQQIIRPQHALQGIVNLGSEHLVVPHVHGGHLLAAFQPTQELRREVVAVLGEFVRAYAQGAGATIHLDCIRGDNLHHIAEAAFKALGLATREALQVVGGGVPPQDYDELKRAGAEAIFPPGTVSAEAAEALLHSLNRRLGHGKAAAE